ncbi:unnamed protein product, partial [Pylaiella littoralis]
RTHQRCAFAFTKKTHQVCTRACTHNDLLSLLLIRLITTNVDTRAAKCVKPTDSVRCQELNARDRRLYLLLAAAAAAAAVATSAELGSRGVTPSQESDAQGTRRAGSPKGEGGKYDNVSCVLARTIRSNLHQEAAKWIGCVRGWVTSASVGRALHERCRCSLEK